MREGEGDRSRRNCTAAPLRKDAGTLPKGFPEVYRFQDNFGVAHVLRFSLHLFEKPRSHLRMKTGAKLAGDEQVRDCENYFF